MHKEERVVVCVAEANLDVRILFFDLRHLPISLLLYREQSSDQAPFITDQLRMPVSLVWDAMGRFMTYLPDNGDNKISASSRQPFVREFL